MTDRRPNSVDSPKQATPRRRDKDTGNLTICTQCGTVGKPKMVPPGSFVVEFALWLLFILPGLIYSVWRVSTKRRTCRTCGAVDSFVPLSSPMGQRITNSLAVAPANANNPSQRD